MGRQQGGASVSEEALLKLFSSVSSTGLEAFNAWLTFKYVEMFYVPFAVVGILFIFGYGVLKFFVAMDKM